MMLSHCSTPTDATHIVVWICTIYIEHCVWCPLESCLWGPTINMLNLQQPDKKINKKVTYRFMCKDFYATIIHKKQNLRNNLNFNQIEE